MPTLHGYPYPNTIHTGVSDAGGYLNTIQANIVTAQGDLATAEAAITTAQDELTAALKAAVPKRAALEAARVAHRDVERTIAGLERQANWAHEKGRLEE